MNITRLSTRAHGARWPELNNDTLAYSSRAQCAVRRAQHQLSYRQDPRMEKHAHARHISTFTRSFPDLDPGHVPCPFAHSLLDTGSAHGALAGSWGLAFHVMTVSVFIAVVAVAVAAAGDCK